MSTIARRSFIAGILAAGVAPMLARSGFLMPVKKLIAPDEIIGWNVYQNSLYGPVLRNRILNPDMHVYSVAPEGFWVANAEL